MKQLVSTSSGDLDVIDVPREGLTPVRSQSREVYLHIIEDGAPYFSRFGVQSATPNCECVIKYAITTDHQGRVGSMRVQDYTALK